MKLKKVFCEYFETMMPDVKFLENADAYELDKEIRLEFEDHPKIYISWGGEPVEYAVGTSEKSWFMNTEVALDVSNWKIWKSLINQECEFHYHDKYHQVLEIKCDSKSIYISTQDDRGWYTDTITISSEKSVFNRKEP